MDTIHSAVKKYIQFIFYNDREKAFKLIDKNETCKKDLNLSPTRYLHAAEEETYRLIANINKDLKELEQEQKEIDKELKIFLQNRVLSY